MCVCVWAVRHIRNIANNFVRKLFYIHLIFFFFTLLVHKILDQIHTFSFVLFVPLYLVSSHCECVRVFFCFSIDYLVHFICKILEAYFPVLFFIYSVQNTISLSFFCLLAVFAMLVFRVFFFFPFFGCSFSSFRLLSLIFFRNCLAIACDLVFSFAWQKFHSKNINLNWIKKHK